MSAEKDLGNASALLRECRTFIDDIVPGCAAGHDELASLKRRVDLFYFEMESRLPNPEGSLGGTKYAVTSQPLSSAAQVHPVVGQGLNTEKSR